MSCRKYETWIQQRLEDGLSESRGRMLDAHLTRCSACRRAEEEFALVRTALRQLAPRRAPDGFDAALAARLGGTAPLSPPAAWWSRICTMYAGRLAAPSLAAAGSLALALLVLAPGGRQHSAVRPEREGFLTAAVARHQMLERANSDVDWEAMNSSIDMNTADVFTE